MALYSLHGFLSHILFSGKGSIREAPIGKALFYYSTAVNICGPPDVTDLNESLFPGHYCANYAVFLFFSFFFLSLKTLLITFSR